MSKMTIDGVEVELSATGAVSKGGKTIEDAKVTMPSGDLVFIKVYRAVAQAPKVAKPVAPTVRKPGKGAEVATAPVEQANPLAALLGGMNAEQQAKIAALLSGLAAAKK